MNSDPVPKIRGFSPIGLNQLGVETVRNSAKLISGINFDKIICSPENRCKETAEIALSDTRNIELSDLVDEVNWGQWQGKAYYEAMGTKDYDNVLPLHMNPPEGESLYAVMSRCKQLVASLCGKNYDNILIVSHGSVISLIICCLLEIPINKYWTFYLDNGKIGELTYERNTWRIEKWNLTKE